jgi:hypothetical protein
MLRQAAVLSLYISIPLFIFLYVIKIYGVYKYPQLANIVDVIFYPIVTPGMIVTVILSKNIHLPSVLSQVAVNLIGLIYIYGLVFCLILLSLFVKK